MTAYRASALIAFVSAFVSILGVAGLAQAAPITKALQQACGADYKKYCNEFGLETAALRMCMDKAGHSLSKGCVNALIHAGQVSETEVDRRKKAGR